MDVSHVGMLVEDAEYMAEFRAIQAFMSLANPGVYPAGPFPNGTQQGQEAEFNKGVEV